MAAGAVVSAIDDDAVEGRRGPSPIRVKSTTYCTFGAKYTRTACKFAHSATGIGSSAAGPFGAEAATASTTSDALHRSAGSPIRVAETGDLGPRGPSPIRIKSTKASPTPCTFGAKCTRVAACKFTQSAPVIGSLVMTGPSEAGAALYEAGPLTSSEKLPKSTNGTRWKRALATLKGYGFGDEPTLIASCEIYLPGAVNSMNKRSLS